MRELSPHFICLPIIIHMKFAAETALGSLSKPMDLCCLQAVLLHLYSPNPVSISNCYLTRTEYQSCWLPWIARSGFSRWQGLMMSISLPFISAEASEPLIKCCSTPVKEIIVFKGNLWQKKYSVTCVRSIDTVYRCLNLQMIVTFKRSNAGGVLRSFLDLLVFFVSAEIAVVN